MKPEYLSATLHERKVISIYKSRDDVDCGLGTTIARFKLDEGGVVEDLVVNKCQQRMVYSDSIYCHRF